MGRKNNQIHKLSNILIMATKVKATELAEEKNSTAITLPAIGSVKIATISYGEKLKKEFEAETKAIKEFQITDRASLQLFVQKVSDANKVTNMLEQKRKQLKEPYLQSGKMIDTAAKEISEELEKAIVEAKTRMITEEKRIAKEEKEEADRLAKEAEKKIDTSKAKLEAGHNSLKFIADYKLKAVQALGEAFTMDALKAAHMEFIHLDKFPSIESFGEYAKEGKAMFDELVKFKNDQKIAVEQIEKAVAAGDKRKALQLQQACQMRVIDVEEATNQQVEEKVQETTEEFVVEAQTTNAIVAAQQSPSKSTVTLVKTWDWELIDIDHVRKEWLCPDPEPIKQFIKDNKDTAGVLTDGCEIDGIRFYIKESARL